MAAGPVIAGISASEIAVAIPLAATGAFVAAFAIYHVAVATAAFFYRGYQAADGTRSRPRSRVVVLVPAHNEAALIERCVRSLLAQAYPRRLYHVVVVADNCTDDTAARARAVGADVLIRDEPEARGKGRALRWAIDRVLAGTPAPDAIVVVDADSVAERQFLTALVHPFERGASAVQGESLLSDDASPAAAFRAAAFLLINRVRPAGRSVLGLPCNLSGNGMLLGSGLLRAHPWDAFTSAEDIEYSFRLRLAGIGPVFAGGAILHSPAAPNSEAAKHQQLRWEGGRLHVAKTQIPGLTLAALRRREPSLLGAAFELAVPPLGLLAGVAVVGAMVGALLVWVGVAPGWAVVPWVTGVVAIPLYVLLGLRAAGAPRSAYRSLFQAPGYVAKKLTTAHHAFMFRSDSWVRTDRAHEGD